MSNASGMSPNANQNKALQHKPLKAVPGNKRPNKTIEKENRKYQGFGYKCRGLSYSEIASVLGVSKSTISSDQKELMNEIKLDAINAHENDKKAHVIAKLRHVLAEALCQFDTQEKGAIKVQFLDKALRAVGMEADFMLKSGIIKGADNPHVSVNTIISTGVDTSKMPLVELQALLRQMEPAVKAISLAENKENQLLNNGKVEDV